MHWNDSGNSHQGSVTTQKGGRDIGSGREGTYVYPCLIYAEVWQKPMQHHKAIILQLKGKKRKTEIYWGKGSDYYQYASY